MRWLGRLDSNQYLRGNNPVGCQLTLHPTSKMQRAPAELPQRGLKSLLSTGLPVHYTRVMVRRARPRGL